jgi:hypothetical protein
MTDQQYETIIKCLKRIDSKLSTLITEKKKKTWVKVGIIQSVTGWDKDQMRVARDNGIVEWRRVKGREIDYCLESIPKIFNKNKPSI